MQVAASLLTSCNRLVINKPISGCVRMAYDSFMTTSLLQVVKRLGANSFSNFVIHKFAASCLTSCNKSANDYLQHADFNRLVAT